MRPERQDRTAAKPSHCASTSLHPPPGHEDRSGGRPLRQFGQDVEGCGQGSHGRSLDEQAPCGGCAVGSGSFRTGRRWPPARREVHQAMRYQRMTGSTRLRVALLLAVATMLWQIRIGGPEHARRADSPVSRRGRRRGTRPKSRDPRRVKPARRCAAAAGPGRESAGTNVLGSRRYGHWSFVEHPDKRT
jgi:hypothetical protein